MGPWTREEAQHVVKQNTLALWQKVHLFDSQYTQDSDHLFATREESSRKGFFDEWRPQTNRPLFTDWDRRNLFRNDNRLFLAIDFWRMFPTHLRQHVDQMVERFPDLVYEYGDRHGGLERMYHFAHERVTQFLIDTAEAHGIDGAAHLSEASDLCRELAGDAASRRNLWGRQYAIGRWPECYLHSGGGDPDINMVLRRGQAVVARLESLLTRWRTKPAEDQARRQPLTVHNSPVESIQIDQAPANAELEAAQRFKQLKPCEQKAWSQFAYSERENPSFTTDQEHYDWLKEREEIGTTPAFQSWRTCVVKGRKALGTSKYRRGIGHPTRSVVRAPDV